MQASKEVWGKVFGTIDTELKFREGWRRLAEYKGIAHQLPDMTGVPQGGTAF